MVQGWNETYTYLMAAGVTERGRVSQEGPRVIWYLVDVSHELIEVGDGEPQNVPEAQLCWTARCFPLGPCQARPCLILDTLLWLCFQ